MIKDRAVAYIKTQLQLLSLEKKKLEGVLWFKASKKLSTMQPFAQPPSSPQCGGMGRRIKVKLVG